MYAAFVSSVYENLRAERAEVIRALWNNNVMPLCMEYFVISAHEKFDGLKNKIDDSDIFVLLFGGSYGSCDETDGIGWTEKEYNYAVRTHMPILSIACKGMLELLERAKSGAELTEDERKQIAFYNKVGFTNKVSEDNRLDTIVTQFCSPERLKGCVGWSRECGMSPEALAKWKIKNKCFDISGEWFHVHLSNDDENYIRIGTATVTQSFTPNDYAQIKISARNHNAVVSNGELVNKPFTQTNWSGSYTLDDEGNIIGIFNAVKSFMGSYGGESIKQGKTRGIHEFIIIPENNTETTAIQGFFYDQAPSKKNGMIYLFRSKEERDMMIRAERPHLFG